MVQILFAFILIPPYLTKYKKKKYNKNWTKDKNEPWNLQFTSL